MDCAKKKAIDDRQKIECTQERPWDRAPVPKDSIVVHDNVESNCNACFSFYSCRNCGFEWIEEFNW